MYIQIGMYILLNIYLSIYVFQKFIFEKFFERSHLFLNFIKCNINAMHIVSIINNNINFNFVVEIVTSVIHDYQIAIILPVAFSQVSGLLKFICI